MTMTMDWLTEKVLKHGLITKEEAWYLWEQPLEELCACADRIRRQFCSNAFDLCTIINGKSGRCSENCKFCAQSAHNHTGVEAYPLLSNEEIFFRAKESRKQGILRYSIVTSGKALSDAEVERVCEGIKEIKEKIGISVCVSFGLLNERQFRKLKEAGVSRVHNNLETSRKNFKAVCTTHTFDEKIQAIQAAKAAGLSVCSGGIMGLGESVEDRIDMALELRDLGIKSVPINMLNPIPGTPYEKNKKLSSDEMRRIVAIYRFILPDAFIRLAGGRGLLGDKGKGCFQSGANAAITGDMLTTAGITAETDQKLLLELGYEVKQRNE